MSIDNFAIKGLTDEQVDAARAKHGYNRLDFKKENEIFVLLKGLLKEPMIILLLLASTIYFISGEIEDGIFLSIAILLVAAISLYQESRSRGALEKLKSFSQPNCKVIRNGKVEEIKNEDLVLGDYFMVEEGEIIVADGIIVHANDFSVDESILTGESLSVYKGTDKGDTLIYSGTTTVSGLAIARITAIGNQTELGKIGQSLENIEVEKTPLELQINNFVTKLMIVGSLVFLVVWVLNYFRSFDILTSLLQALTLAMSILPEEIPVAFATFMALGAWRLMKMGIVVKQMKTVETLGIATIICTDKTGTITENKMSLAKLFILDSQKITDPGATLNDSEKELIRVAMWASEPIPFDPMEKALHRAYSKQMLLDERRLFNMVHEYPLGGKPPMMTHVFENKQGKRIIAAKGAPEAFLEISRLTEKEKKVINTAIETLATQGYRLLGVAEANFEGNDFPNNQEAFPFQFKGIVAFYDPPKNNIQSVFEDFYTAGLEVKIITGDNAATTTAIAKQVGFKGYEKVLSGNEVMTLPEADLANRISTTQVFTRMFPEAKLKVIQALKGQDEIVAMIGDGVNDGPALKAAHIGIAMGKKGTEIAKQAASLILLEDDFSKLIDAIAMGRKIYANLKKAIQYIISIHIPIILVVFIPLALGWIYPNIFSPIHVIFLELIMGPTCSIIYESEPMEKNTMAQKPRVFKRTFFSGKELLTSIIQGLMITAGILFVYQYAVGEGLTESYTRTLVFTTLISANVFLTLVNRSFKYSIFTTLRYKNKLMGLIIGISVLLLATIIYIDPIANFFEFSSLNVSQLTFSIGIGFISVVWYELVKWRKRLA